MRTASILSHALALAASLVAAGCEFAGARVDERGLKASGPGNVARADESASARTEAPSGALRLSVGAEGEAMLTSAQPGGQSAYWVQGPSGWDVWAVTTGDLVVRGLDVQTSEDGTRIKAEEVSGLRSPVIAELARYAAEARGIWISLSADDRAKAEAALKAVEAVSPPLLSSLRALLGGGGP